MNYEEALNNVYDLVKKHVNLFSNNAYNVSILPGWIPLVDGLLDTVQRELKENERFQIVEIKEKFGSLRIYFGTSGINQDSFACILQSSCHSRKIVRKSLHSLW